MKIDMERCMVQKNIKHNTNNSQWETMRLWAWAIAWQRRILLQKLIFFDLCTKNLLTLITDHYVHVLRDRKHNGCNSEKLLCFYLCLKTFCTPSHLCNNKLFQAIDQYILHTSHIHLFHSRIYSYIFILSQTP